MCTSFLRSEKKAKKVIREKFGNIRRIPNFLCKDANISILRKIANQFTRDPKIYTIKHKAYLKTSPTGRGTFLTYSHESWLVGQTKDFSGWYIEEGGQPELPVLSGK